VATAIKLFRFQLRFSLFALGSSAKNGVNLCFLFATTFTRVQSCKKGRKEDSAVERAPPSGGQGPGEEKRYVMGQRGVYAMSAALSPC